MSRNMKPFKPTWEELILGPKTFHREDQLFVNSGEEI